MARRSRRAAVILAAALIILLLAVALSDGRTGLREEWSAEGVATGSILVGDGGRSAARGAAEDVAPSSPAAPLAYLLGSREIDVGSVLEAMGYELCDGLLEGLREEVLSPPGDAEVLADGDAHVVGWSTPGIAEEVFRQIGTELKEKGWKALTVDGGSSGSFVKEGGRFQWLFVMCYQVGDRVSVVVNYR